VITDAPGRAVAFVLAPGQEQELRHVIPLLDKLPGVPRGMVADRGYSSRASRQHIWDLGARPVIPTPRHEETPLCPPSIYASRNRFGRLCARLKEWRTVAIYYGKTARSFMGIRCLAATCSWIRCYQVLALRQLLLPLL
jgi:transposase